MQIQHEKYMFIFPYNDEKKIEDLKKRLNTTEKENKALFFSHKDLTKQIENKFEVFNNKIELLRKTLEAK